MNEPLKFPSRFFIVCAAILLYGIPEISFALPEYAAYSGSNCMACHVGPMGGFARKPNSPDDFGWVNEKLNINGDLTLMGLYDKRDPGDNRMVIFPMQGSLSATFTPKDVFTITASQDFGILREIYAMFHNVNQTAYVRAGFFTLPYGILFPDHTSFVKEGRIESGPRSHEEIGIGAKLFGVRYKDSGIEGGFSGKPFFLNFAITSGVVGQESRAIPDAQGGTNKARTTRMGFILKNVAFGVSTYNNDSEVIDRRISRYGAFGWLHAGPFALLFEHDEGDEEQYTVSGSTQLTASYVELFYSMPFPGQKWPSFVKVRYERMDPNRSVDNNEYQRWVFGYKFSPLSYFSVDMGYRNNLEKPHELNNDDIFVLGHFFF